MSDSNGFISQEEFTRKDRLRNQLFSYFLVNPSPRLEDINQWGYDEHLKILYGGDLERALRDYYSEKEKLVDIEKRIEGVVKELLKEVASLGSGFVEQIRRDVVLNRLVTQSTIPLLYQLTPEEQSIMKDYYEKDKHYAQISREHGISMDDVSQILETIDKKLNMQWEKGEFV